MTDSLEASAPTRKSVYTPYGSVSLERIAPQHYRIFMEDIDIGTVSKKKLWHCGDDPDGHPARLDAIKAAIVQWSKARLTPSAA
jgi:hypothetical protein